MFRNGVFNNGLVETYSKLNDPGEIQTEFDCICGAIW